MLNGGAVRGVERLPAGFLPVVLFTPWVLRFLQVLPASSALLPMFGVPSSAASSVAFLPVARATG